MKFSILAGIFAAVLFATPARAEFEGMFLASQAEILLNLEQCGYPAGDEVAGRMGDLLEEPLKFTAESKVHFLEKANQELSKVPGAKPVESVRDAFMVVVHTQRTGMDQPWTPAEKEKRCPRYKQFMADPANRNLLQYYLQASGLDGK